jgi:hypothetical protein
MSEWILLIYPVVLFTGLMLAARRCPKPQQMASGPGAKSSQTASLKADVK